MSDSASPLLGVTLDVPQGAVSQATLIEIVAAPQLPPLSNNEIAAGPAVELRPTGATFQQPLTLRIPYPDANQDGLVDGLSGLGIEEEFLQLRLLNPVSQSWSYVDSSSDPQSNFVEGEIEHFSVYRLLFSRYPSNSVIRYRFGQLPLNRASGITDVDVQAAIRRAIQSWANELRYSGITVLEAAPTEAPNITFRWGNDPLLFANPVLRWLLTGEPLAVSHSFTLTGRQEVVFYDDLRFRAPDGSFQTRTWTTDPAQTSGTVNIEATAVHELGHALGLGHPCRCQQINPGGGRPNAVMNATQALGVPLAALQPRDSQAYRDSYGLLYAESAPDPVTGASVLFLIDPIVGGRDTALGHIRSASGSPLTITDIALLPRNLAINSQCCFLFGISFDKLYLIDLQSAVATQIGSGLGVFDANALVFDRQGILYAGTVGGTLLRVDTQTGLSQHVGLFGTGFSSSGDLGFFGFFGLGPLYATVREPSRVNDILVRIDPTNGTATRVHSSNDLGFPSVFGTGFASPFSGVVGTLTRKMFGLTSGAQLVEINPATGTATLVRQLTFRAFGGSSVASRR